MTECFLIVETGMVTPHVWVREAGPCPDADGGDHEERVTLGLEPARYRDRGEGGGRLLDNPSGLLDSPHRPTVCSCGHRFTDEAFAGAGARRQWARVDDPTVVYDTPQEAGPGAMWDAWWMPTAYRKADGRCLVAITPDGHEWMIDSTARNCTRPGEDHDCWCRHGDPPRITVDKHPEPGRTTCAAGAGSIATPGWHGFLRDGRFVTA